MTKTLAFFATAITLATLLSPSTGPAAGAGGTEKTTTGNTKTDGGMTAPADDGSKESRPPLRSRQVLLTSILLLLIPTFRFDWPSNQTFLSRKTNMSILRRTRTPVSDLKENRDEFAENVHH